MPPAAPAGRWRRRGGAGRPPARGSRAAAAGEAKDCLGGAGIPRPREGGREGRREGAGPRGRRASVAPLGGGRGRPSPGGGGDAVRRGRDRAGPP